MELSESLKRFRKQFKITQKQAAKAANISERNYQDYEYGKVVPTVSVLTALADCFNVPLDYLTGQGIFANWDAILEARPRWAAVLDQVYPHLAFLGWASMPEKQLMRMLPAFFTKMEIDGNNFVFHTTMDLAGLEPHPEEPYPKED